jgi:hypothetical protein
MNLSELDYLPQMLICSPEDLRDFPEYSLATRMDWSKVARLIRAEWPAPPPAYHLLGADRRADVAWWQSTRESDYWVFDVETEQLDDGTYTGYIIQVGLGPAGAPPAIWDRLKYPDFNFAGLWGSVIASKPVVAHNAKYDVSRVFENFGIPLTAYVQVEDTMLMHHTLYTEFPQNLNYCISLLSDYNRMKHLGVGSYDYLLGDIIGCNDVYLALKSSLERDPCGHVYFDTVRPLLREVIAWEQRGSLIDQSFVLECLAKFPEQRAEAARIAEAYAGFPISLDSPQLIRTFLTEVEDIYAEAKKKQGFAIKKKMTDKGEISFDKDSLAELRTAWAPVPFKEQISIESVHERITYEGAHPLLEAMALHGANRVAMRSYLKPLLIPLQGSESEGWTTTERTWVGDARPSWSPEDWA